MWQRLVEETGLDLVSVAVDIQGPDVVRPYTEAAGATYQTFVDPEATLPRQLGCVRVPVLLVFEEGRLCQPPLAVDVRKAEHARAVRDWARGRSRLVELPTMEVTEASRSTEEAAAWFQLASLALNENRREDAKDSLGRALQLDSNNRVIQKQRWAVNAPERFYGASGIDKSWQTEQQAVRD